MKKQEIRKCSVCLKPFESEGLVSCPIHSFGEWRDIEQNVQEESNKEELDKLKNLMESFSDWMENHKSIDFINSQ